MGEVSSKLCSTSLNNLSRTKGSEVLFSFLLEIYSGQTTSAVIDSKKELITIIGGPSHIWCRFQFNVVDQNFGILLKTEGQLLEDRLDRDG